MMQVECNDTAIANETFQRLKIDVTGTQLAVGKLHGRIQASFIDDVIFMSAYFNRKTLFHGGRMPGMTPLSFMTGQSPDCYFHGDTTEGAELCGFHLHKQDTMVHWQSELCVIYVPTMRLMHYLEDIGAEHAMERMDQINQLPLSAENRRIVERLFRRGMNGSLTCSEQVMGRMAMMLEEPVAEEPLPVDPGRDRELSNFVRFAHESVKGAPLSVPQIFKSLGLDVRREKTLRTKCKAAYGLGLAALAKRCRLEQARVSLRRDHLTVKASMAKHSFIDRKQFNSDYYKVYGVRPEDDRIYGQASMFDL